MIVHFHKIADDRKIVDKAIDSTTLVKTCNSVHYKDDVDILNPVLEIAYDASLTTANYVYVPDWCRYYYINNITTGMQRLFFECHVDVLKTYSTDIKKLNCVIARQENKYNLYLNDAKYHLLQYKTVVREVFPKSFSSRGSYILAVGGDS